MGNTHTSKASKEGCCTEMRCGTTHEVHISTRILVRVLVFIYLFAKRRCAPLKILAVTPCTVSVQGIYDKLALHILNAAFPQHCCFTQSGLYRISEAACALCELWRNSFRL